MFPWTDFNTKKLETSFQINKPPEFFLSNIGKLIYLVWEAVGPDLGLHLFKFRNASMKPRTTNTHWRTIVGAGPKSRMNPKDDSSDHYDVDRDQFGLNGALEFGTSDVDRQTLFLWEDRLVYI